MNPRCFLILPLLLPALGLADTTLEYASEARPGSETIIQVKGWHRAHGRPGFEDAVQ